MATRRPLIADRRNALLIGGIAYALGALMLWDAFEHRGRSRPFWTRAVGGLV